MSNITGLIACIVVIVGFAIIMSFVVKTITSTAIVEICTQGQESLADLQVGYLTVMATKMEIGQITQAQFDTAYQELLQQAQEFQADCLSH